MLNIVFYGGEPTLYPDKIKYFVGQAKGILPQDTDYTISTNGSKLLDDNFLGWCVEHGFTLNISYDGTPQSELRRIYKNGSNTQQEVLNILEQIKTEYPEYWDSKVNILVTLPDIHHLKPLNRMVSHMGIAGQSSLSYQWRFSLQTIGLRHR